MPLDASSARLVGGFGDQLGDTQASGSPRPSGVARYRAGDDWAAVPEGAVATVHPIGPGTVLAADTLAGPTGTGIVVVGHTGFLRVPESPPGAAYAYPEQQVGSVLSVYEGLVVAPGLAIGGCVDAETPLGATVAPCEGVAAASPCVVAVPPLHVELRLASTADPTQRSADWVRVGPPEHSVDGAFLDPQAMVDDGLRDPAAFIVGFGLASPAPTRSSRPIESPAATATPTSRPTPVAITDPAALVRAGVPRSIRSTCTSRTQDLVTGTLAAVDCRPDSPRIKQVSYFLLRPADARFVFASRMRQHGARGGADCHAGKAGVESRAARLSVGCFVDDLGRANIRFAARSSCPAVYVGVLGTGRSIGRLADAYDTSVGEMWRDPGSKIAACRRGTGAVSRPPAPTHVVFKVHARPWTDDTVPDYRLEVTWHEQVEADTTIEVYAVMACPRKPTTHGRFCMTAKTKLPSSILELQAQAPAGDGSASWLAQGWEEIGGPVAQDKDGRAVWGIVVRAVNSHGASRFVIAKGGNGWACSGCVY